MQNWFVTVASLILLSALGAEAQTVNQLQILLDESHVSCDGVCPEAVGRILTWDSLSEKKILMVGCTGFMATADIVATDSHCIPQEVIANPALCSERIGIKFPAQKNRPAETAICSEMIQASSISEAVRNNQIPIDFKNPDFAFFRIQKTNRTPLTIRRTGVKNDSTLTFYVARKVRAFAKHADHMDAIIKPVVCKSSARSVYTWYLHDFSLYAMSQGDSCKMEHGDSGAPGIDESGAVPTILVAATEIKAGLEKYAATEGVILQNEKPWSKPIYSLNYACLDLPAEVAPLKPSECANIATMDEGAMEKRTELTNKFQSADRNSDLKAFQDQAPRIFWVKSRVETSNRDAKFFFELKCLIAKEYWSKVPNPPPIENNMVKVKYYEQSTGYKMFVDPKLYLKTIKVKDEKRQNEISINLSLVGAVDSVVGTRTVNGVEQPFSTHWCSTADYAKN